MKLSYLGAGLAVASLASAASAATFVVTDVEYPNLVNINLIGQLPGGPYENYTQGGGPIFLTGKLNGVGAAETLFAYCDDIPHHIGGGGGQDIVYDIVPFTQNNAGDNPATNPTLTQQVIWNIDGLANLGYQDYLNHDNDGAGVAQGAIWIEEYRIYQSNYSDPGLEAILQTDLALEFGPPSPALLQLQNTNDQGQLDVQGQLAPGLPVPEPAAWATMILGFFGLGGTLRRRRVLAAV